MSVTIGINQAKELLGKGIAQAEEIISDPSKVDELLIQFENKLKEVPVIGETLSGLPTMIGMIKGYITGKYTKISPKVIATLVGAVIYLVKKEDVLPDSLPVIGLADDIAVIGAALKLCEPELEEYAAWRDGGKEAAEEAPAEAAEEAFAEVDEETAEFEVPEPASETPEPQPEEEGQPFAEA